MPMAGRESRPQRMTVKPESGGHTPGETQVPDAARGGGDQSRVEAQVMAVPAASILLGAKEPK
jgi:hypothetical protein